jgi:hypothetical protein
MGCNCGGSGGGSALANYEVKDKNGTTVKTFSAVREIEVKTFAAKNPGSTYRKTS